MMRYLIILSFLGASLTYAAIGDNAPSLPSTYVASHPRLGAPSNAQLLALWNGGALPSRFSASANSWDTACTARNCDILDFRYMLMAYLASKAGGAPNASWKAKLMAMEDLGPVWGPVLLSDNNALGDGAGNITDASVDFTTGCNSGSCDDVIVSFMGLVYVTHVSSAHAMTVTKLGGSLPYSYPNGSNLKMRILSSTYQFGIPTLLYAMMYDWMYADFTTQQQSDMQTSLANICLLMENDFANNNYSPYNDEFYGNGANSSNIGIGQFAAAMAIYPDAGAAGLTHLRWSMDAIFNIMLPAWKQVMSQGGWHESWNDYQNGNNPIAMRSFIVPPLLMWANASGLGVSSVFTTSYPWIKNWAYQMMYVFKPDFVPLNWGDTQPASTSETATTIGSLNGLAEIYNDPVLRGWARFMNGAALDGNEPSAWPYYTPDKPANSASDRSSLPLCRNFTGWGMLICRSGWTENDTWMSFKYGDSFWSHEHFDAGHFDLFNRGTLAIDSGTYHAGSGSRHRLKYAIQAIAHNTITVTDPSDSYSTQLVQVSPSTTASIICEALPNDGGQRRVGSGWQSYFTGSGCTGGPNTTVLMNSPSDIVRMVSRARDIPHGYSDGLRPDAERD